MSSMKDWCSWVKTRGCSSSFRETPVNSPQLSSTNSCYLWGFGGVSQLGVAVGWIVGRGLIRTVIAAKRGPVELYSTKRWSIGSIEESLIIWRREQNGVCGWKL